MNVVVCIRRVPDTETKVKIGSDGIHIDETGIVYIINPYDEYAIEEALKIKEARGQGEVIALSVGPESCGPVLRKALAMGADRAIHVRDDGERDALGIAQAIRDAVKGLSFDMIWFGRQSIDEQRGQVGPTTARLLGLPCVTDVVKFELQGAKAVVHKSIEGNTLVTEVALPAAFTAQKGLNEPRFATMKGIMQAKKKPLDEVKPAPAAPAAKPLALKLPPARKAGRIVGEGLGGVAPLIKALQDEAKLF